jgi:hypothetical protein
MPILVLAAAATIHAGPPVLLHAQPVYDGDGPIGGRKARGYALQESWRGKWTAHAAPISPAPGISPDRYRDQLVKLVGVPTGRHSEDDILVRGRTMRCRSEGAAGGSRTAACCVSPRGRDLSCAKVRAGWTLRWRDYWAGHQC